MSLPIVFLHKGNQDFIKYTLAKATETNPDSKIYLIGDSSNRYVKNISENLIWLDYENYAGENSNLLIDNYIHMSTNPAPYEFICIDRWFVINEFMKKEDLNSCFISDTDVLLYSNVTNLQKKYFKNHRCTLTHNVSAGISFMNDRTILEEYIKLVLDSYTKKDKLMLDKASAHYQVLQNNNKPGGVCDMTWWMFLRNKNPPFDFGESMSIVSEESGVHSTFDHNINVSYGYDMENGIKKFKFKHGIPYCYNKTYNLDVKFNCIHFQGQPAKNLIRSYYEIK